MAYNTKSILKDVNGKPIPQYWNPNIGQYEPITSKDGRLRVIMVDENSIPIQSQDLVDQIKDKIDDLIEAVSG